MSEETAVPQHELREEIEQDLEEFMSGREQAKQEARYILGELRMLLVDRLADSELPNGLKQIFDELGLVLGDALIDINDY